jgi:signal transduction histidine kinase
MSHEIRTPFGIMIYSFIDEVRIRKNQSEYMSTINESATSLMQIVNDVLIFLKLNLGN